MLQVRVNNFFILSRINIFLYPKCTIILKNYSVANYLVLHSGNMTSYRVMINMGNHILAIVLNFCKLSIEIFPHIERIESDIKK